MRPPPRDQRLRSVSFPRWHFSGIVSRGDDAQCIAEGLFKDGHGFLLIGGDREFGKGGVDEMVA